jgi:hypothetical protein
MSRITASALRQFRAADRRRATRYDLRLNIQYALPRLGAAPVTGTGESVNVSSSGVLFRSNSKLPKGDLIVAAVDWPVAAPDNEPLCLVLTGYVVRTKGAVAAISMRTHQLVRLHQLDKRYEVFFPQKSDSGLEPSVDARAAAGMGNHEE